jgi:hypothetical protein
MTKKIDHETVSAIMIQAGAKYIQQYLGAKVV